MNGAPIDKFVTFKPPQEIVNDNETEGIRFTTHVVMSDGQHLLISDVQNEKANFSINETLVFRCNENGSIESFAEVQGARNTRTDEVISMLNSEGYQDND